MECSHRFPSYVPFDWVLGPFWAKKKFWEGTSPSWRPRPGMPPVSFWLKTWIWQGHHLGNRMAKVESSPKRWNGAMAKTERRSACCLLACLLVS